MEEVKDATTGDVKNSLVELYQVMSEGTVNATDSYNYNVHNVSIMEALDAVARIRKENGELTEKLNVANARLNRAMVNRRDIEEELLTIRKQYESILRDYRETMSERSNVLEENNKLTDERDFFREKFKILASIVQKFFSVVDYRVVRSSKLSIMQSSDRLCEEFERLNSLCYTNDNNALAESLNLINSLLEKSEGKDINETVEEQEEEEPLLDMWHILTIQLTLKSTGLNSGIILGGGKTDDVLDTKVPLFVKDVIPGSPFDGHIKRLDHILFVNDINVSGMDQRSVKEILCNSRNLKIVIKRRDFSCRIKEIKLNKSAVQLGAEFENGVFVSKLYENGSGIESGLSVGNRIVYINDIPIHNAFQAEKLINAYKNDLIIGVVEPQTSRRTVSKNFVIQSSENKQRSRFLNKVHEKLFGRSGNEKIRPIIAQANLDACAGELMSCRHGSLRIPSSRINSVTRALVRTGSLRTTSYSIDQRQINEQLEKSFQQTQSNDENEIIKLEQNDPKQVMKSGKISQQQLQNQKPVILHAASKKNDYFWMGQSHFSPSTTKMGSSIPPFPNSTLSAIVNANCPMTSISNSGASAKIVVSSVNFLTQTKAQGIAHAKRINTRSPALPQPPPYPGQHSSGDLNRSSNLHLMAVPSSSYNYSPTRSMLRGSGSQILSNGGSTSGVIANHSLSTSDSRNLGLHLDSHANASIFSVDDHTNINPHMNIAQPYNDIINGRAKSVDKRSAIGYLYHKNSKSAIALLYASAPRRLKVLKKDVRLCGGNISGILIDAPFDDVKMGERVLDIDGYDLREAVLEEAVFILERARNEVVTLTLEYDGGKRLENVKAGADCDGFYVKVNIDRNGENSDELDLKKGEILYVDNTLFMGVYGRWRAWKLDQEGRQRHCGLILSLRRAEEEWNHARRVKGKMTDEARPRHIYERVERLNSSQKRPLVLVSAYLAPFMQILIEEYGNRFVQCVAECRASNSSTSSTNEMDQWIEVRKREELFEMISVNAMKQIVSQGYHCVLDITPQAVLRLHSMRLYPIIIRIKFKSIKQLKELAEHSCQERLNTKAAKELLERAQITDTHLEKIDCTVSTINVGAQYGRNTIRYVCQQIVAIVEHEQKRIVWVPAVSKFNS